MRNILSRRDKDEVSIGLTKALREALIKVGDEEGKIIIIGKIDIQLNMSRGGGATVEVRNK